MARKFELSLKQSELSEWAAAKTDAFASERWVMNRCSGAGKRAAGDEPLRYGEAAVTCK